MSASVVYDIIGYVGSALIVVSLTRTSILKLRLFGLAGSVTFLAYSLLIEAYPIAIVNVIIIGVHLWFLRELLSKKKEYFRVLEVLGDSRYLHYFLDFYAEEIRRFQPDFNYVSADDQIRAFILRDLVPAGLFIGRRDDDGAVEVLLDFVIPQYRDFKVGRFLYSTRSGLFADPRCDRVWSRPATDVHDAYFEEMGFEVRSEPGVGWVLVKDLRALHSQQVP